MKLTPNGMVMASAPSEKCVDAICAEPLARIVCRSSSRSPDRIETAARFWNQPVNSRLVAEVDSTSYESGLASTGVM